MTIKSSAKIDQYCQQWLTVTLITTGITAGLVGSQLVSRADTTSTGETTDTTQATSASTTQAKTATLSQASVASSSEAASQVVTPTSTVGSKSASSSVTSNAPASNDTTSGSVAAVSTASSEASVVSSASDTSAANSTAAKSATTTKLLTAAAAPVASKAVMQTQLRASRLAAVESAVTLPANGVYGTAKWDIDANGVLTIHAGETANGYQQAPTWSDYNDQITSVMVEDGVSANENALGLFANLKNVTTIDLTRLDTSNTWGMESLFDGDNKLAKLDLSHFDTSHVKNMAKMFNNCFSLGTIDVSNFDTANVNDMSYMFSGCGSYSTMVHPTLKYSDKFVTSNVNSMEGMFAKSLFRDLSITEGFDTKNVNNMANMFNADSAIGSLNLSSFNTSEVTRMQSMFAGMEGLKSLNISNFDTAKVTDMGYMFHASGLTNLDLSTAAVKNFSTDSLTSMQEMFSGNSYLRTITLGRFTNPVAIKMNYSFAKCPVLTTINGLDKFGASSATTMEAMFIDDPALTKVDLSNLDTKSIETMRFMFQDDRSLVTANISGWKFSKDAELFGIFEGCTSLKSVDLTGFRATNGVGLTHMFYGCSSLTEIDLSKMDISGAKDPLHDKYGNLRFLDMLAGCTALWKVIIGPSIITTDLGLPDAPGNQTKITDGTDTYLNIGPYWQLVDDGKSHTPAASIHHPEGDLQTAAQVLATDSTGAPRTYVWQQTVPATVTIQYQDENQKELQPSQSFRGVVDDTYQVGGLSRSVPDLDLAKPAIAGYTFKEQQGTTPDGTLHEPAQVMTYVYTRTSGAPITVSYWDDTKQQTLGSTTLTGYVGDTYQSTPKSFAGYTLVASPEQPSGVFDDQAHTLTYHYTQNPILTGTVTIQYQDQAQHELAPALVLTQPVGTSYQSTPLVIPDYQLKTTVGTPNGVFGKESQTVTYIYEPVAKMGAAVTVHYVDTTGKVLAAERQLTGKLGDAYQATALTFDHYQLKRIYGAPQGQFTATAQTVTYEYQYQSQASLVGQDYTMTVGDVRPTAGEFQARATDDEGSVIPVVVDLSHANLTAAGDYQVTLTAATQVKTVTLHILANQQQFAASDYTMDLGAARPTVADFKGQATNKAGQQVAIQLDLSQVDFSQAGRYNVILSVADGRTKNVQLILRAVTPTVPVDPTDPTIPTTPVEPTDPTVPTTPVVPIKPTDPAQPVEPTQPQPAPMTTVPTAPVVQPTLKQPAGRPTATQSGALLKDNAGITKLGVTRPKQSSSLANTNPAAENLPQTSEQSSWRSLAIGLSLLLGTCGAWLGLKSRQRRH